LLQQQAVTKPYVRDIIVMLLKNEETDIIKHKRKDLCNSIILTVCATLVIGHAIGQVNVTGFPSRWPGVEPRSGHVGFVVDKAALGQVFSEYFGFPCQALHRMLHARHHSGLV
jgi:hypothetical protein